MLRRNKKPHPFCSQKGGQDERRRKEEKRQSGAGAFSCWVKVWKEGWWRALLPNLRSDSEQETRRQAKPISTGVCLQPRQRLGACFLVLSLRKRKRGINWLIEGLWSHTHLCTRQRNEHSQEGKVGGKGEDQPKERSEQRNRESTKKTGRTTVSGHNVTVYTKRTKSLISFVFFVFLFIFTPHSVVLYTTTFLPITSFLRFSFLSLPHFDSFVCFCSSLPCPTFIFRHKTLFGSLAFFSSAIFQFC